MNEDNVNEQTNEESEEKAGEKSYFGMTATDLATMAKAFMENKDAVKQVVDIFKPVIADVSDLAMDTAGPEIYKVLLRISLANVRIKKAVYDEYMELGFTAEQAFYMIANDSGSSSGTTTASKFLKAASSSLSNK